MADRQRQKGQTMLELIITIGIIVSSVMAILGLVIATTKTSSASKAQILATNLAREGIEIARSIRDNNWLSMDVGVANSFWNKSLYHEGDPGQFDFTAIVSFQPPTVPPAPPGGGFWTLLFSEDVLGEPRTEMYFHPTLGLYSQVENTGGCPTGPFCCPDAPFCDFRPIQYWRLLHLNPICWPLGGPTPQFPELLLGDEETLLPGEPCFAKYNDPVAQYRQVGILLRSRVRWMEHGRVQNVEVDDKLFDWKP